jgi:predicted dehydrogenase
MIESQQGARHLERARPFLEAGLPTFVDKPFAQTVEDAEAMIALAEQYKTPLLSCSSLRYDPQVTLALAQQAERGRLLSADIWGACSLHEGNPGLLHYGIHGVETLYALLGPGCREVRGVRNDAGEVQVALWENEHLSTLRGLRAGQYGFGFVAHYEKGNMPFVVEGSAAYRELLKVFVRMCETRTPPLDYAVMAEIMRFIRAADASADQNGAPMALDD